ncbi:MAG: hypothetical protein KC656_29520, partial [Myxococcales bacterium]|nr:hypothetical protein [Myxococcales bacterium]
GLEVLEGQAVDGAGASFSIWALALRRLAATPGASPDDVEVLRSLADGRGGDLRIDAAFEAAGRVARALDRPMLWLLEDVQWAHTPDLELLRWLAPIAREVPLAIVCTYRIDERPGLASEVPNDLALHLPRLSVEDVSAWLRWLLGSDGFEADVPAAIHAQTEGLPLFVVELLRDLTDGTPAHGPLAVADVRRTRMTEGMERWIRGRFRHASPEALEALRTAAIAGRAVDWTLLDDLHPDLDRIAWRRQCAEHRILASHEGAVRFAHDKFREYILATTPDERLRSGHAEIAAWLETHHGERPNVAPALAHHLGRAGDTVRWRHWSEKAGLLELSRGGAREAYGHLQAAADGDGPSPVAPSLLRPDPAAVEASPEVARHARLQTGLAQAAYQLGDTSACVAHAERALVLVGQAPDPGGFARVVSLLGTATALVRQLLSRTPEADPHAGVRATAAEAQELLTEMHFYGMDTLGVLWSVGRLTLWSRPGGPSVRLAEVYALLGIVAGLTPVG